MEVKWIKITTDIFDDEKILLIESLPSADSIIVIWFKLLVLAGKQNNNGVFMMSNRIPYTDEMLAVIFRRDIQVVRLALRAFAQYGMIEIIEDVITIPNWGKHQSLDKLEEIREQTRQRVAKHREKLKLLNAGNDCNATGNVTVALGNALDKNKNRLDKDIDKDKEKDNTNVLSKKKNQRHKYGTYENVLLSDEEMQNLQKEFPYDWEERIERVSEYVAMKGKGYNNYLATIRSWAKKETVSKPKGNSQDLAQVADEVQAILDNEVFW